VRLLVDGYGASVDRCDGIGFTPLMAAAAKGEVKIVQFLLEKGARTVTCSRGCRAIDFGSNYPAVLQVLVDWHEKGRILIIRM